MKDAGIYYAPVYFPDGFKQIELRIIGHAYTFQGEPVFFAHSKRLDKVRITYAGPKGKDESFETTLGIAEAIGKLAERALND